MAVKEKTKTKKENYLVIVDMKVNILRLDMILQQKHIHYFLNILIVTIITIFGKPHN